MSESFVSIGPSNPIRQFFDFLDRRQKWQVFLLLVAAFISSVLELLSIGLVIPLINYVFSANDGANTGIVAKTLGNIPFIAQNSIDSVKLVLLAFAGLFVVKSLVYLFAQHYFGKTLMRMRATTQTRIFFAFINRSYLQSINYHTGELVRDTMMSANAMFNAARMAINMILEMMIIIFTVILLLYVETMITLCVGFFILLIGIVFRYSVIPWQKRIGLKDHVVYGEFHKWAFQGLAMTREIQLTSTQGYFTKKLQHSSDALAHSNTARVTMQVIPRIIIESSVVFSLIGVLLVMSGSQFSTDQIVSVVTLFGVAAFRLVPSINRILGYVADIAHLMPVISHLHSMVHGALREHYLFETPDSSTKPVKALKFASAIALRDLHFSYPGQEKPALGGISFDIHKGESIGIVGPSGSGKSTLLYVLLGMIKPDRGGIEIDGSSIWNDITGWWANLGYVPQMVNLIDDTVARNVALGIEDSDIDPERLARAVSLAQLNEVIADLPQGMDTVIGEHGMRLSGGQRQRLAIARALYHDPEIIIFDEATSALDNETEREIARAIDTLSGMKTIIIVAHRISTIRKCNRIVCLRGGMVEEIGDIDDIEHKIS